MRPGIAVSATFLLFAGCQSQELADVHEVPLEGGLLVRVVDAAGAPVAGAEVLTEGDGQGVATYFERLFAGSVGRVERFGTAWRAQASGEIRIPARRPQQLVVARFGELWGCAWTPTADEVEGGVARTIVLERDRSLELVATDVEGRPGTGAIAWIWLEPPADSGSAMERNEIAWGATIVEGDGTLRIPHAQLWRALKRSGWGVNVSTFVLWADEMVENRVQPFPLEDDGALRCVVSPAGSIVLSAEPSLRGALGILRWLDAPKEPEDPDEVPEFPIGIAGLETLALPLGRHFEIVFEVPTFVDPRVAFDGPKSPGEHVEVAIGALLPAARVTGRLVDADGNPMPRRVFDAWLERDGARVEAEEDVLVTNDEGRFAFDLGPGDEGTLHVRIDGDVSLDDGFSVRVVLGSEARDLPLPITARHEFTKPVPAGEVALGDVVCGSGR